MSEPISYRLLEAVKARLTRIRVSNGYRTDIGADVRVEEAMAVAGRSVVFIGATAFTRVDKSSTARQRVCTVEITVEVVIATARDTASRDAHRARSDVLAALFDTSVDLPRDADGSASGLVITTDSIDPRIEGAASSIVLITAQSTLTELLAPREPAIRR